MDTKKNNYLKQSLFLALLLVMQNVQAQSDELGHSEQLLDGYAFNYQYQNQTAIHIEFEGDSLRYRWIKGLNKPKDEKKLFYYSRKIDNGIYLIQWHEIEQKNLITLVFNFNAKTVASSVIVRYGQDDQFTTFDAGFITQLSKIYGR